MANTVAQSMLLTNHGAVKLNIFELFDVNRRARGGETARPRAAAAGHGFMGDGLTGGEVSRT